MRLRGSVGRKISGMLTAESEAWTINYKEIKFGDTIGAGNVGTVTKGVW